MANTASASTPLDLNSLKDSLHSVLSSDGFATLKRHFDDLRSKFAPAAASATTAAGDAAATAAPMASNMLTSVTKYAKANPVRSIALAIGAAALMKRLGAGKVTGATALSGLGILARTLLAARK